MQDIPKITQGTDFTLRVRAKRIGYNNYVKVSFEEISNITTKLVSLPNTKTPVSYTMDEQGRLVIPVDGTTLDCNTYGVEIAGFYNSGNWRQMLAPAFEIIAFSGQDSQAQEESEEITIDLEVTLGETYVSSRVFAKAMGEMDNSISKNAEDITEQAEKAGRMEQEIEQLPSSIPTKTSQLTNDAGFQTEQQVNNTVQTAVMTSRINDAEASLVEDGGQPELVAGLSGQKLILVGKNLKGEKGDDGEKGETGEKGDKGVQGDSAVYDPDAPDAPDFEMANTTGQSTTKAMTQKAVTEALACFPTMIALNGKGGTDNTSTDIRLQSGRTYRITLDKTEWEHTSQNYAIFSIGKYVEGNWVSLFTVSSSDTPQKSYEFTVGDDTNNYSVAFRGDEGQQLFVTIEEVDAVATFSTKYSVGSGNGDAKTVNASSGFRYIIYINKELSSPCKLRYIGDVPTGVQYSIQGFTSLNDAKGTSVNPTESTSYDDSLREYEFTCQYLRVIFKASSGNLTTAQMNAIKASTILETIPLDFDNARGVSLQQGGENVYPIVPSKGVTHKGSTLDTYLDGMALILPYAMSDMAKSSPIASRRRYTVKVPIKPIYVSVEGNPPSGMTWYMGTSYSLSDAQSASVINVESVGWGETRSAYFSAPNANYLTIGWKKSNNGSFSAEDIAALEASGIKLVVKNFSIGENDSSDIIDLNGKAKTLTYLRNAKRPQYRGSTYSPTTTPCTLLHFSDIHADEPNMKRIVQFYNYYKAYIDDALCTGDIIKNLFSDSFAFWENAEAGSILNCIGNHEYYNGESSSPYYKQITQKQVYDKFFAPYIEDWGVTQPEDAEENGLNYYYKDYATSKVRLIVLDNFRVDADQLQWFEDVLSDAITNNYHVVAAIHIGNPVGWTKYDNPFNSLRENNPSSGNTWVFGDSELLYDKVDDFIDNGGIFVGWLMGHRHSDAIGTPHDHPNQLEIHVATASCGNSWDIIPKGDNCDRTPGSKSQDCFNIYSIDTYYKMIRIHRIGSDVDRDFRHIGNLCYDYENHQVIYCD
ncbi:MAG: hypothetical protein IKR05_08400 [Prevotella sp.]|nr:hypothetical protein [Prevotella sp.]